MELAAVILTLICVYLTRENKTLNWPIAMLASIAYFIVFFEAQLYAEMVLQILFFGQAIHGWYYWNKKKANESFKVEDMTWLVFVLHFTPAMLFCKLIHELFLPQFNIWDMIAALLSVIATYYTAKKVNKAWGFWIVVNIISIILFTYKELYMSAVLYIILLGISISGLIKWEKMSSYERV